MAMLREKVSDMSFSNNSVSSYLKAQMEGFDSWPEQSLDEVEFQVHGKRPPSPEKVAAFNIGLERLSREARQVVDIVLDMPMEFVNSIVGKASQQFTTRQDLQKFFRSRGMSIWEFRKLSREIERFLRSL